MSELVAENVRVGFTGAIYVAPRGTPLPTDADTPPNAAFTNLGFISEDGVTETPEEDSNEIKAWQNATVVRRVTSSFEQQYVFTMIESKKAVLETYYKGSTVESDGGTGFKMDVKTPTPQRDSYVIDVVDGDEIIRTVIADGEVIERGEVMLGSVEDPIGYEVTLTSYPVDGTVATKYSTMASWGEVS